MQNTKNKKKEYEISKEKRYENTKTTKQKRNLNEFQVLVSYHISFNVLMNYGKYNFVSNFPWKNHENFKGRTKTKNLIQSFAIKSGLE